LQIWKLKIFYAACHRLTHINCIYIPDDGLRLSWNVE